LREARDRITITELLDRVIELTHFEAVMLAADPSAQRAANVRRMLELARAFEAYHFFKFHDLVAYLRRLVEEEPREPQAQILGENENVVRLMTVHQAKGLEFPIVIVADLWRKPPRENATPLISPTAGLVLCDTIGAGYEEVPNPALKELRDLRADEEQAESARILYVAITRARDRLILSAAGKRQSGTWGSLLSQFIDDLGGTLDITGAASQTLISDRIHLLVRAPDPMPFPATPTDRPPISHGERDQFAALARTRLCFEPPSPDSVILSPSELEVIARCPREYYWRYQARLPPNHDHRAGPWIAAATPDATSDGALRMGLAAHAVLERVDFGINGGIASDELGRLIDAAGLETDLNPEERTRLRRDLNRYLSEVSFPSDAVIEREVPFFLRAGDAPVLFVRGRIDLLCITPSRIIIRDYKYTHPTDAAAHQIQMEVYALAAAEAYPGRWVDAEVVFLRDAPQSMPLALPPLDSIRSRLHRLTCESLAAQSSGQWSKRPANEPVCRKLGCGYIRQCWGSAP